MADRIGVILKGEMILVEEKTALMKQLGKKELTLSLQEPMTDIPAELSGWQLALNADGRELHLTFDSHDEHTDIPSLLKRMNELSINFTDLNTHQSSLEDIFVNLVSEGK
jgi:ABC-2 type transport system ATP-binding protein